MTILSRLLHLVAVSAATFSVITAHAVDPRLAQVQDYAYLLQVNDTSTTDLANSAFDMFILDYSRDGSGDRELTPEEIAVMTEKGKIVLAYLSIGEAEEYRYYWQTGWNQNRPTWLGPENPQWRGNYKVRYWDPQWQAILFGTAAGAGKSYLDRIIDQGFDGIYLDIVDGYYYWSNGRKAELSRLEARTRMVNLVANLRSYARVTRGKANFLVFPQNAQEIIYDDNDQLDALGQQYLDAIDGLGCEDVWFRGTRKQKKRELAYVLPLLEIYRTNGAGRLVLDVDYIWNVKKTQSKSNVRRYNIFKQQAADAGVISYAAPSDRELDTILTVNAGGSILTPQPLP